MNFQDSFGMGWRERRKKKTCKGCWDTSRKLTYPLPAGTFKDDFPFPIWWDMLVWCWGKIAACLFHLWLLVLWHLLYQGKLTVVHICTGIICWMECYQHWKPWKNLHQREKMTTVQWEKVLHHPIWHVIFFGFFAFSEFSFFFLFSW